MTQRTRTQGPIHQTAPVQMNVDGSPSGSAISTTVAYSSASMTDVVTDGFRSKVAKGIVVNNPCTYTKIEKAGGGGFFSTTRTNPNRTYSTSGAGSVTQYFLATSPPTGARTASLTDESLLVATAKAKALGNIDRSPFNIAEDIAEMRETVQLLRDPLEAIRHLTDSLRRRSRRNPITNKVNNTVSRSMAEVWATNRFGYYPMMNSIETVVASLGYSDVVDVADKVIKSSHGKASDKGFVIDSDLRRTFGTNRYDKYYHSHSKSIEAKAYVLYRHYNPVHDWRWKYGLRAKDLPELLWAIVPYSFIVDRVSNISTSLRGITALSDPSIEILGGGVTTKVDTFELWKYLFQSDPPYVCSSSGDEYTQHTFTYTRALWSPNVLDTFVKADFNGLVKDITSIVDLIALTKLAFS